MCNQTATPPDRVQEKNGDAVILKTWYRRPDGVDLWAFGNPDDLVEVELETNGTALTAVKYLEWKNLGHGGIARARVLRTAEQMLDIIRDSDVFREYVNDAIKASKMLTDAAADAKHADAEHTAAQLTSCRAALREAHKLAAERGETIRQLETQIANMRVKIQYAADPAPASEIEWLRSVVERTLADR